MPKTVYIEAPTKDKKILKFVLIIIGLIVLLPLLAGFFKGFSSNVAPSKMIEKAKNQQIDLNK